MRNKHEITKLKLGFLIVFVIFERGNEIMADENDIEFF